MQGKLLRIRDALDFSLRLLEANAGNKLFSFLPELYLESTIDLFHSLRRADPPVLMSQDHPELTHRFISFCLNTFEDARVIKPGFLFRSHSRSLRVLGLLILLPRCFFADTKDLLLQSISVLLQYKEYIAIFETNATSKEKLMKILFESFDGRLWVQVASIISRFWKGVGFAENPAAPSSSSWLSSSEGDSSSPIFQHLFREFALKDPEAFSKYLNKLFNQLNWVATEFGVAVQAVRDWLFFFNWRKSN